MKKLSIALLLVIISCLSMVFFVANVAEKEIKAVLLESQNSEFSIKLVSYQRNFFSAMAISEVYLSTDPALTPSFKVTTKINHYPYQATLTNNIEVIDEALAKKLLAYFDTKQWITSTETINLFSQLSGKLSIAAGQYESESESISNAPLVLDYDVDLNNKKADFTLNWAGLNATTHGTVVDLQALKLTADVKELSINSDYNYQLNIDKIVLQQDKSDSLLEGLILKGSSQKGQKKQTIDTTNELLLRSYQLNSSDLQTFTDNRLKLALTGLYQPAMELLNSGSGSSQEIELALIELVSHGAQLKLSQLKSQTPWGEVDGELDVVLDKGALLTDILFNPYILFDYMSGDASLVLPVSLLDEPLLAEPLQMGLMTGFLKQNAETLNLETSFHQGELTVNGRVIPL